MKRLFILICLGLCLGFNAYSFDTVTTTAVATTTSAMMLASKEDKQAEEEKQEQAENEKTLGICFLYLIPILIGCGLINLIGDIIYYKLSGKSC